MSAVSQDRVASSVLISSVVTPNFTTVRRRKSERRAQSDQTVLQTALSTLEAKVLQTPATRNEGTLLGQILSEKGNDVSQVAQNVRTEWEKTGHLHQSLTLNGTVTTAQIDQILEFFPNIHHLTLEGEAACQLAYFAECLKDAETLQLKSLLSDKPLQNDVKRSLDTELLTFAFNHPYLKALHLQGCPYNSSDSCLLTPTGVCKALAQLPHVTTLSIRDTIWWRKEAMQKLAALNHPSIATLDIRDQEIGKWCVSDVDALVTCLSQLSALKTVHVTKALCSCRTLYTRFKKGIELVRNDMNIEEYEGHQDTKILNKITLGLLSISAFYYSMIWHASENPK